MSVRGLMPQTLQVPLAAGLAQKEDPRALQPPGLSRLVDGQFDELGGIQLRKPYAALAELADCRRIVANGDELLVFTRDALHSWDSVNEQWVRKGTHLAVHVDEASRFASTADQIDADRAELGGVIWYSWHELLSGNSYGHVAAIDAATGAVLLSPMRLPGFQRIRLTALETKVLLSFYDGLNGVYCYALDPSDPGGPLAGNSTEVYSGVTNSGSGSIYDVCRVPGADQAVFAIRATSTSQYVVATMTAGLIRDRTTKTRTADGAIAVSCPPTGTHVQVVRVAGADVRGDLVDLGDFSEQQADLAIGSSGGIEPIIHVAAAHRSGPDAGAFRCYVFWRDSGAMLSSNWVDTEGDTGTAGEWKPEFFLASRAFSHGGRVYVWTSFLAPSTFYDGGDIGGRYALQQTYFLFRDDGLLVAKAAPARAGDLSSPGFLPSVQPTTGGAFAWAGLLRGLIPIGGGANRTKYSARSPRDITFAFDSDEARRCTRLGRTLYITGGEIRQYDGTQLTEVGFHIYPYSLSLFDSLSGDIEDGTYAYQQTWRWDNAQGETERSTSATVGTLTLSGGPQGTRVGWLTLGATHKDDVACETWRTQKNPMPDSPFYLVTSKDPASTTNPNRYLSNNRHVRGGTSLDDNIENDDLLEREILVEGVLESMSPPAATIIAASADRLFLAGVAGDPSAIWYSRLRNEGEVASFHENLRVVLPASAGPITGLAYLNETLVAFTGTAVYALPGDGFDNAGNGLNLGPARVLSSDVGAVVAESIALTPNGLVFKARKGWYLLNRGWSVEYIGGGVSDYDAEAVLAVHVVETQHQVRALTESRMLVFDYLVGQWAEWSIGDGLDACIWRGRHTYLAAAGPRVQSDDYAAADYGLDIETAWIPLGSPGWGRVWKVVVLGEYRSSHELRVRLARDYSDTCFQDKIWSPSPSTVGGPLQIKHGPSIQAMQALRVRLTVESPSGESLKLTNLSLEVGLERGLRPLRAAQQQ